MTTRTSDTTLTRRRP